MKYGGLLRAAKVVKSALVTAEKANLGKLFAEISVPMRLDHPNLTKLFEVFEYRGQYVLIQELCEGGDLFQYIKQSRFFSESKAGHIIRQVLSAVNYMHKQGVMHRDLKPENILVDSENDTLKIGDFGTATPFSPQSCFSELVGTPYYVAPEVVGGSYSYKCDVWSCGVILYILLCGSPPFNGKNDREILERIQVQPLDFRSKQCLTETPSGRSATSGPRS
jgi:calcium-dependent protein kinase